MRNALLALVGVVVYFLDRYDDAILCTAIFVMALLGLARCVEYLLM